MNKMFVCMAMAAVFLTGCASGVSRAPSATLDPGIRTTTKSVASVSVSFTEEGRQAASENLKFSSEELRSHVKRALEANSLLTNDLGTPSPDLDIQIKRVRVRSNFSAVMWGVMAGADKVAADIVLMDKGGKELDRFEVSVSYALGGLAGGQDSTRMSWLYEKFAEEAVKELKRQ